MNTLFKKRATNVLQRAVTQTNTRVAPFNRFTVYRNFCSIDTSKLTIGVPKEVYPNEKRVAISPEAAGKYIKQGFNVSVERGAGVDSKFEDSHFEEVGAKIVSTEEAFGSDFVLKVRAP